MSETKSAAPKTIQWGATYQRLPSKVQAMQLTPETAQDVKNCLDSLGVQGMQVFKFADGTSMIRLRSHDGRRTDIANGDWITLGSYGVLVYRDDEFRAKYEPVI